MYIFKIKIKFYKGGPPWAKVLVGPGQKEARFGHLDLRWLNLANLNLGVAKYNYYFNFIKKN